MGNYVWWGKCNCHDTCYCFYRILINVLGIHSWSPVPSVLSKSPQAIPCLVYVFHFMFYCPPPCYCFSHINIGKFGYSFNKRATAFTRAFPKFFVEDHRQILLFFCCCCCCWFSNKVIKKTKKFWSRLNCKYFFFFRTANYSIIISRHLSQ